MQARKLGKPEQLPAHRFKTQIRNKQRQQIRNNIMAKFQQQQAIHRSLQNIQNIVGQNIQVVQEIQSKKVSEFHEGQERMVFKDYESFHFQKLDLEYLINEVIQLNHCLREFPADELLELINPYFDQSTDNNPWPCETELVFLFKFKKLIQFHLPHISLIVDQLANSRMKQQESWLKMCVQNFEGANLNNFKKQIVNALIQVTHISDLGVLYVFPNHPNSHFQEYFFQKYFDYEPAKLISEFLIDHIEPSHFWFLCLIAMNNLLFIQYGECTTFSKNYEDDENYHTSQITHESKRLRQILNDINFDQILENRLSIINFYYENYEQRIESFCSKKDTNRHSASTYFQQKSEEDKNIEKNIIRFIKVYIKWNNSINYEMNENLQQQIEKYVIGFMSHIVNFSHKSPQNYPLKEKEGISIDQFQFKIIKHISGFIDHFQVPMDNIFIVNILLPIIRSRWDKPQIAKIWKNISFLNDYRIPYLIVGSHKRVHTFYNQDNRGIGSNQNEQSDSEDEHTPQFAPSEVSLIRPIFEQILVTIAQTQVFKVTMRRDKDLMEGLYNMMLQMEAEHVCQLWEEIYERNQWLKERIEKVENICLVLQKIETFIMQMKQY